MQAKPCHRYVLIEQAGTPHTIRNAKSRRSSPPGTDQAFRSHFYLGRDRLKYAPKRKGDRYQRSFAHIPSVFSSTSLPTNIFNLPITQAPVVIAEAWPDMAGGRMRRAHHPSWQQDLYVDDARSQRWRHSSMGFNLAQTFLTWQATAKDIVNLGTPTAYLSYSRLLTS